MITSPGCAFILCFPFDDCCHSMMVVPICLSSLGLSVCHGYFMKGVAKNGDHLYVVYLCASLWHWPVLGTEDKTEAGTLPTSVCTCSGMLPLFVITYRTEDFRFPY